MFGTRRRQSRPSENPAVLSVVPEIGLTAVPDTLSINRERALLYSIGVGLQGYAGTAVGYDRGNVANSMTTVIDPLSSPTSAMANVGRIADAANMAPPAEITDIVMSDPALDPYQALLWNRIGR